MQGEENTFDTRSYKFNHERAFMLFLLFFLINSLVARGSHVKLTRSWA